MSDELKRMRVQRIDDQGDRLLLYSENERYYVIAGPKDCVEPGDEIEYEPYGANFGWFKQVTAARTEEPDHG